MADDGRKPLRMTDAERTEALAKLVQRTTKLTEDEVVLLHAVWKIMVRAHFREARFLVVLCIPGHTVRDVMQDIFLAVFRALLLGFPDNLRAFIRKITSRKIANWLRDHEDEAGLVSLPASSTEKPRSSAPGIDSLVAQRELRELGERLRSMLSPEHQAVFDLVIVGDVPGPEAAAQLGLPEGTFKSRVIAMRRAVQRAWETIDPSSGNGSR